MSQLTENKQHEPILIENFEPSACPVWRACAGEAAKRLKREGTFLQWTRRSEDIARVKLRKRLKIKFFSWAGIHGLMYGLWEAGHDLLLFAVRRVSICIRLI
jgi:hypothetical protein